MKIVLNTEPLGYSKEAVKAWLDNGFIYQESSWQEINELENLGSVTILIVRLARKIDLQVLNKFPNLKTVVSATTGLDHLDLEALDRKNIRVISLKGEDKFLDTIPSTAEHTWALILSITRNITISNDHVKLGNWKRDLFRANQLKGKTLGIIGYGRIGKMIAHYASAFNMNVAFYDPFIEEQPKIVKYDTIEKLLSESDIVSLHVHLNSETTNLINRKNLMHIKPGAIIINTSRGKIIDEEALVEFLEKGVIKGAAVDVLSFEFTDITMSPLWSAQQRGLNVIITPHIGGASWEAMWECEVFTAKKAIN